MAVRAASSTQATSAVSSALSMPAKNEPKPTAATSASPIDGAARAARRGVGRRRLARRQHDAAACEHDARDLQRAGPLARRQADQHGDRHAGRRDRRDDAHRPDRERAVERDQRDQPERRRRSPPTPSTPRRAPSARPPAPPRRASRTRAPARAASPRARGGAGSGSRRGSPTDPTRATRRARGRRPAWRRRLLTPRSRPWTHVRLGVGPPAGTLRPPPRADGGDSLLGRTAGMISTIAACKGAIRREADQLESTAAQSQFRRRRIHDNSAEYERLVHEAAVRAKGRRRRRAAVPLPALRRLRLRLRLLDRARRARGRGRHAAHLRQAAGRAPPLRAARRRRSRPGSCASPTTPRSTTCARAGRCRARRSARATLADDVSGRERFADLRLALDALPPEQRDVIVLRFLVGLTPREVAERMGRSEDAVHGLQHRGRRSLRREMQRIEAPPRRGLVALAAAVDQPHAPCRAASSCAPCTGTCAAPSWARAA